MMKKILRMYLTISFSIFSLLSMADEIREGVLRTPDERFENLEA